MNLKSPAMLYREAVDLLVNKQNALFQVVDNHIVEWYETELEQPSQEEILLKYEELKLAEPLRLMREERNNKLAKTDWEITRGLEEGLNIDSLKAYRQALRDLPVTAEPQLDENGNLININWPEKPE